MDTLNEKKTDKLNFDFSVNYHASNNNSYNYRKIVESLKVADFKKAVLTVGILTASQVENILKYPDKFVNSKSKYDEFSTEKKSFRLYFQTELKKCEILQKKGIDTKVRENNYKYLLSFAQ